VSQKREKPESPWRLSITLKAESFAAFFPMVEKGVLMPVQVGASIKSLLCDQIGLSEAYVDERIQTSFLNGKPVDDLDAARVPDGSTLALSAAMPGLLGATMRKGSYYAQMRAGITHQEETKTTEQQEGWVTVKLFNLLIREMGPVLLKRGVWVAGEDLESLLSRQTDLFWTGVLKGTLNGRRIDKRTIPELAWPREGVLLTLEEARSSPRNGWKDTDPVSLL
jgi:hypothetical protein